MKTRFALPLAVALFATLPAFGQMDTTPTMDPDLLKTGLHATGLTINSIIIKNGVAGQFGTFRNFNLLPVTIRNGIVLSCGDVTDLSPLLEAQDPNYDPASPPARVSNQMNPDIDGSTPEFNAYGFSAGNIENFQGSFDVASLEVTFTLDQDSSVAFDFIFGSVEFPFYTGSFTDSFLVFLDGTDPVNQITFDANHNAVQVGSSFAGLETTADRNSAFSNPHGVIHHLTTTTDRLDAGLHTLRFEVGDVNDHILDSAAFITDLRATASTGGGGGTGESEDCPADFNEDGHATVSDIFAMLGAWFRGNDDTDYNGNDHLDVGDIFAFLRIWFAGCQTP